MWSVRDIQHRFLLGAISVYHDVMRCLSLLITILWGVYHPFLYITSSSTLFFPCGSVYQWILDWIVSGSGAINPFYQLETVEHNFVINIRKSDISIFAPYDRFHSANISRLSVS